MPQTPSSSQPNGINNSHVQNSGSQRAGTVSKEVVLEKASKAELPPTIQSDVKSWIKLAQTIAVTSALFAAVQISLNQIIESAVFASGGNLQGHSLSVWRGLRWFMYSAVILNLGCAGSAVAVINMAASLECRIGELLLGHWRLESVNSSERRRHTALYDWVIHENPLSEELFEGPRSLRRLQEFGLGEPFYWFSNAMLWAFSWGGIVIFVSFLYWVILTQGAAAFSMMSVVLLRQSSGLVIVVVWEHLAINRRLDELRRWMDCVWASGDQHLA
ncbi:SubName: Full=Uncharacterized protein {ECO:0000313/EMBL:CCA75282.1} [Serendipita indica DSM 11827]|nr:SubName: Full=Uncharacterized protein {ECO:0000313/EMBL:CCA75282.1} [Serendipita indica DSM 11827]